MVQQARVTQLADDQNTHAAFDLAGAECSSLAAAGPHASPPERPRGAGRSCGALPFLVQRDGTWLYRGTPIRRKPMVCLFASVLTRDAEGAYWMQTPTERGTITVEDAPFVAVELHWAGCGRSQVLSFRTNVDLVVCAGPEHPIQADWNVPCAECGSGPVPYLHVRDGDGAFPIQARIARAVYYELAAWRSPGSVAACPAWGCGAATSSSRCRACRRPTHPNEWHAR